MVIIGTSSGQSQVEEESTFEVADSSVPWIQVIENQRPQHAPYIPSVNFAVVGEANTEQELKGTTGVFAFLGVFQNSSAIGLRRMGHHWWF